MTTFSFPTDAELDQDSPVTVSLMTRLRDNVLALAEGDPTAPNINVAVANNSVYGGVGTYILARLSVATDIAGGALVGGSLLQPCSAIGILELNTLGGSGFDSRVQNSWVLASGVPGTWRAMSYFQYASPFVLIGSAATASLQGNASGVGLWQRVV